jgi:parvulin-like peptidyl-prolyl isomerase
MALFLNGEPVDEELIEAEFHQVKGHYERLLMVSCCERDAEFRATAKDNVLSRLLLNQEAARRFPEVDEAEVTARLEKLIEQAGGEAAFYMNLGMPVKDEELVRRNVAGGVRLDKLLTEVYGEDPEFTEAELREYYDSHLEVFMSEEMIRAAHITKSLQGASSRTAVYQELRGVRERLLAGEDFMTLAEEHRADDQQQIDLGWFKRGEFMEEFETIAFSMRTGEISPVFVTQLGFHICTVLERRPAEPLPFAAVKDAVRQRLLDARKDAQFNAFIDRLKAAAVIEDTDPPEADGCAH